MSTKNSVVLPLHGIAHTVNVSPDANGLFTVPARPKLSIRWGSWSSEDCQCSGLGERVMCLGGWSFLTLCPSAWHTRADMQWSMKTERVKWKKGDELTASAKECPEKLQLNGEEVEGRALIHRLQTQRGERLEKNRMKTRHACMHLSVTARVSLLCFLTLLYKILFYKIQDYHCQLKC